jgi:hypothetical protein
MQCTEEFMVETMGKATYTLEQMEHPYLETILAKEVEDFQTIITTALKNGPFQR